MTSRKPVPLHALRVFEAAARLGRMTDAATELAVTHSAISRQLQHLEAYLGTELFAGPRNRRALTPPGQQLLSALTPIFDQIDVAVRSCAEEASGVLDVACYSTFAMRWLIPRLHRFQKAHATIEVRLSTDLSAARFSRGHHDVSITALAPKAATLASDVLLFAERLGPVAAPSLIAAKKRLLHADLARLPHLTAATRVNAWHLWCTAVGQPTLLLGRKPSITFDHYAHTLAAAANGLGVCVSPLHLVLDDIASGRLRAPFGFVASGYRYVARPRLPLSRKTRHFIAWLQREAAADATSASVGPVQR
jgi:LysR family transcriptional regulator, glycine cleavage system transcriptional activator